MSSSKAWFQTSKAVRFDSATDELTVLPSAGPQWEFAMGGLVAGAVLVERLRTFGGRLPDLNLNKERLGKGASCFGLPRKHLEDVFEVLLDRLLAENRIAETVRSEIAIPDLGLVVLFIPNNGANWVAFAHLSELPFSKLQLGYSSGVRLTAIPDSFASVEMVPTDVKHRSRIHYWVADRKADLLRSGSNALLMDRNGAVGDTSFANLVLVSSEGEWLTPASEYAHLGVTVRRTKSLLQSIGVELHTKRIGLDDLSQAQELILVGSTGIATPVDQVVIDRNVNCDVPGASDTNLEVLFRSPFSNSVGFYKANSPDPVWRIIHKLWEKEYGIDVMKQSDIAFTGNKAGGLLG